MVTFFYLVLIPILLFAAAIFAAIEASLFSLSRTQLENLRLQRPALHKRIRRLIQQPESLLSTIIIGNECLNILIGTFIVTILERQFHDWDQRLVAVVAVLVSSMLLLTFSEILPKVLAFRIPLLTASILVYPAKWAHITLTPLRNIFLTISTEILKVFNIQPAPTSALSEKDLLTLVEVGEESGSLDKEEKQLIYNVFHFSDISIQSVMTPWKDVFHLPEGLPMNELLSRVRQKTFSRIPMVSGNDRKVAGILYTKELLKLLLATPDEAEYAALMKKASFPPYIVSSHKKISRLFREFKLKKIHMALVVDEYGRSLGVVTLEDILNALFQTQKKMDGEKKT